MRTIVCHMEYESVKAIKNYILQFGKNEKKEHQNRKGKLLKLI